MTESSKNKASALKAAKKCLKKAKKDSPMKVKALAKLVAKEMGDGVDYKDVKKWISNSDKFTVDGKKVTVTSKKRSSDDGPTPSLPAPMSKKAKREDSASKGPSDVLATSSESSSSSSDPASWRKDNKIVIKHAKDDEEGQKQTKAINKDPLYFPLTTFDASKSVIAEPLIRQCTEANGFNKPSPIQAQSWPILMHTNQNGQKRDVVGIAETGSGKTIAFGLPALTSMMADDQNGRGNSGTPKKRRLPRMLVLSPTRELAMQVESVLEEYGAVIGIRSLVLYGGVPKHKQVGELKKNNVDCLVATPGRLKDLINDGTCALSQVQYLVLDEADRMLDMGFEEDVRYIISKCMPKEQGRQSAMFSATWPASIAAIAMEYMTDPVRVYVGFESIAGSNGENSIDDSLSANKRVEQNVEVIEDRQRESRMRELLHKYQKKGRSKSTPNRILVFALYKKEAERLEYSLKRDGFDVCSIHGNKNQEARTQALADFKSGNCPLMVATDVAARGLDIPDVEVVLNYTFPLTIEDYVHRIGRTGRAGKQGISYTFFQPTDKAQAGALQAVMRQAGQTPSEALMKFGSTIKKKEHKLYGSFGPKDGVTKKATKITFNDSDDES